MSEGWMREQRGERSVCKDGVEVYETERTRSTSTPQRLRGVASGGNESRDAKTKLNREKRGKGNNLSNSKDNV
jgi:hypothetical protein